MSFSLANRETYDHLGRARSTASHKAGWADSHSPGENHLPTVSSGHDARRVRHRRSGATGDIFDRGRDAARGERQAQLLDDRGAVVVTPRNTQHPLIDRRTEGESGAGAGFGENPVAGAGGEGDRRLISRRSCCPSRIASPSPRSVGVII